MPDLLISDVRFHRASTGCRAHGLLGWVNFIRDGRLHVDGVRVCRSLEGRIALSYPNNGDAAHAHHLGPLTASEHQAVEDEVITYLRARGHIT